jgi:hypothetical protein
MAIVALEKLADKLSSDYRFNYTSSRCHSRTSIVKIQADRALSIHRSNVLHLSKSEDLRVPTSGVLMRGNPRIKKRQDGTPLHN